MKDFSHLPLIIEGAISVSESDQNSLENEMCSHQIARKKNESVSTEESLFDLIEQAYDDVLQEEIDENTHINNDIDIQNKVQPEREKSIDAIIPERKESYNSVISLLGLV